MMWKTVKLGDVCDLQNGFAFKSNLFKEDGLPILRISNIQEDIISLEKLVYFSENDYSIDFERYKVHQNDLLIAMSGATTGKLGFNQSGKTLYLNQRVGKFLPHKTLNKKYLYYILSTKVEENLNISRGAAQPNLSTKQIKDIEFFLPSLAEQESIVAKLDAAFAEIDEAIKNINLKESKLDKFKSAIISDSYRGSGWDNERLGDCVSYEKNNAKGSSLPYVGMENIAPETMDLVGEVIIPEKTSNTFHFNKSHVLFGRLRPYLRKVLVPDFEGQCSTEIFCIKPKDKVIREFLAYWLLEQSISSKIEATSTGARMPRANMNALLEFDFPIPSIKEQKKIISKIDLTFTKISEAKNTLAKSKTNYFSLKSAILSQELQPSEAA